MLFEKVILFSFMVNMNGTKREVYYIGLIMTQMAFIRLAGWNIKVNVISELLPRPLTAQDAVYFLG